MAENDIRSMAILLSIMGEPHPEDYVIMFALKTMKYLMRILHRDKVKMMFQMTDEDLDPILERLKEAGIINILRDGYLEINQDGQRKYHAIRGYISVIMENVRENRPVTEWKTSRPDFKK